MGLPPSELGETCSAGGPTFVSVPSTLADDGRFRMALVDAGVRRVRVLVAGMTASAVAAAGRFLLVSGDGLVRRRLDPVDGVARAARPLGFGRLAGVAAWRT